MEKIEPPTDSSDFNFWGYDGQFLLPEGFPNVELHYRTEPPHGDFLYSLEIGEEVVADGSRVRLFWGRNLVLSPCATYLAVTEFPPSGGAYSVFNLRQRSEWHQNGYFRLCSLVFPILTVRPWIFDQANVTYGTEANVDLEKAGQWKPMSFIPRSDVGRVSWPNR